MPLGVGRPPLPQCSARGDQGEGQEACQHRDEASAAPDDGLLAVLARGEEGCNASRETALLRPFEAFRQRRAPEEVSWVGFVGPAVALFSGVVQPFVETVVLGDPVPQFAPVADECVMDQLGHRLPGRGIGVPGGAERLGGDDAMACECRDDVVDGLVSAGTVVGARREVAQFVERDLGTGGRDVVVRVGRAHQGGQDPLGDGPVTGGQPVEGRVAPGRQAAGDSADALVGVVGEVSVLASLPQLAEGQLEQGQYCGGHLVGHRSLAGRGEDVDDDLLGQPRLQAEPHVMGGQGDDVVQVLPAQGARNVEESGRRGFQELGSQGGQAGVEVVAHDQDDAELAVRMDLRGDLVHDGQAPLLPFTVGRLGEELFELVDDQHDTLSPGFGRQSAGHGRGESGSGGPGQPGAFEFGRQVLPGAGDDGQPAVAAPLARGQRTQDTGLDQ